MRLNKLIAKIIFGHQREPLPRGNFWIMLDGSRKITGVEIN